MSGPFANSSDADKCIVVAGASGLVGTAAAREFASSRWRVIGLCHRPPTEAVDGVEYLTVDLRDPAACRHVATALSQATHLVYAAVNATPGGLVSSWLDPTHAERNGRMFENLFNELLDVAVGFQHVTLVQGTKAYGVHRTDCAPVPLRETLPRPAHDNFYFRQ